MKKDLVIIMISTLIALVFAIVISFTKYCHWMFLVVLIPVIVNIYLSMKRNKNN
ncbi:hypothetical protein GCM10019995_10510 [Lactobacillus kefiranofaciens subsp. kefirgranum]|nr:hypothetical protein FC94_GL000456 [Lactobacillus kefiranofaciens subsp. kefirgranum DSM 10550 = JCM 8572]